MQQRTKLFVSVLADILGMGSYLFPVVGEMTDIVYAPLYGLWIAYAYENKTAGVLGALEEALPFTDAIPTATITHFYELRKRS